jgi:hypothetical protein
VECEDVQQPDLGTGADDLTRGDVGGLVDISRLAGGLSALAEKNKVLEVGGAGQRLKTGSGTN